MPRDAVSRTANVERTVRHKWVKQFPNHARLVLPEGKHHGLTGSVLLTRQKYMPSSTVSKRVWLLRCTLPDNIPKLTKLRIITLLSLIFTTTNRLQNKLTIKSYMYLERHKNLKKIKNAIIKITKSQITLAISSLFL